MNRIGALLMMFIGSYVNVDISIIGGLILMNSVVGFYTKCSHFFHC